MSCTGCDTEFHWAAFIMVLVLDALLEAFGRVEGRENLPTGIRHIMTSGPTAIQIRLLS